MGFSWGDYPKDEGLVCLGVLLLPAFHSAGDVGDFFEAIIEHPHSGAGAPHPGGAENVVGFVFREIARGLRPAAEGKELAAINVGHEEFILFADIEEDAVESGV